MNADPARVDKVVIVGGGAAGWMTAAALARVLGSQHRIELVESDDIGIIGVGEATLPSLAQFNRLLQIDEADFVRQTKGTFKLGIQFVDWARLGDRYLHGFGGFVPDLNGLPFHLYWHQAQQLGKARELGRYSLNTLAANAGKFMVAPSDAPPNTPLANIAYAYHFDAGLYARYLRQLAEGLGVKRTEGKIVDFQLRADNGFVESIVMESGVRIAGDLFVDCSGFRSLLIEKAMTAGFEDWTHWLPMDRAIAVPCERVMDPTPYTRSTARPAGWQWRIPLQHRTGNGHVYSSRFMSDDEARAILLANLDGRPTGEPRLLSFAGGKRKRLWIRNVVAVGLAGGFVEPLESTAIFLIQSGVLRLLRLFPQRDCSSVLADRFNAESQYEYERIRDFLILHYCATERDDTPFWNYVRSMEIPESLRRLIALFRDGGRLFPAAEELFGLVSWVQVMIGQRIVPTRVHPQVAVLGEQDLVRYMDNVERVMQSNLGVMPTHQQFIDRHCKAPAT